MTQFIHQTEEKGGGEGEKERHRRTEGGGGRAEKEDKKEGGKRRRNYFEMQINQMQCCLCPDFNKLKKDTYERIEKLWV